MCCHLGCRGGASVRRRSQGQRSSRTPRSSTRKEREKEGMRERGAGGEVGEVSEGGGCRLRIGCDWGEGERMGEKMGRG